jgi:hypothetical protein
MQVPLPVRHLASLEPTFKSRDRFLELSQLNVTKLYLLIPPILYVSIIHLLNKVLILISTRIRSGRSKFSFITQPVKNRIAKVGVNFQAGAHGFGFFFHSATYPTKHFSIPKSPCSFIHFVLRFIINLFICKLCLSFEISSFSEVTLKMSFPVSQES